MATLMNTITWMVGGAAGAGINASGEMFSRCFTRGGLNVLAYLEYPSLIRGGHNSYHIRVSPEPVYSQVRTIDLLVCLNKETFELHKNELSSGAGVLFDPENFSLEAKNLPHPETTHLFPVPFLKIVKEHGGIDIMRNTVALGASLALFKYPFEHLEGLIVKQFEKKGEKVVSLNVKMAKIGYDYILEHFDSAKAFPFSMAPTQNKAKMLLSGNQSLSYGAMKAGCKLFCAYPMTPASSILSVFAKHERDLNIVVKQPEDELAAVLYCIGAGYAGVRAMTSTSGGGFALMVESLSLAGMIEVPLVVVESQRPGPATGFPTWTGQADLKFVIHAGHDEFPKLVLAPGDVSEAYLYIQHAFNFAEKYHIPVIVLSDKYLSESHFSANDFEKLAVKIDRGPMVSEKEIEKFKETMEDFPRYQVTESGVSPRILPGTPHTRYVANSYEHDATGELDESAENRIAMHQKRLRKMETLAKELPDPPVYGPEDADLSIIAWGSTKGAVLEAMRALEAEGIRVNFMHVIYLSPFPKKAVSDFLKKAKKSLLIEGNYRGQLGELIREHTLLDVDEKFLKYDGRPFYPEEICEKVKNFIGE